MAQSRHISDSLEEAFIAAVNAARRGERRSIVPTYLSTVPITTATLIDLAKRTKTLYARYVLSQIALFHIQSLSLDELLTYLVPECVRAQQELGDFQGCIALCKALLETCSSHHLSGTMRLELNASLAKAFRNRGDIPQALEYYRSALITAGASGNQVDVARILLLIGKVYGNYLGQTSLYLAFVEEAEYRLESLIDKAATEDEQRQVRRTLAICKDTLGQAHRDTDPARSQSYFEQSIRINESLKKKNATIRAQCHLVELSFRSAQSPSQKVELLEEFVQFIELMRDEAEEQRGLGVRYVQYGAMLLASDRIDSRAQALECAKIAEEIASRFADLRTHARALILKSTIVHDDDDEAVSLLQGAASLARQSNLRPLESTIYLAIATRVLSGQSRSDELRRIVERNRDLYHHLLRIAINGIERFSESEPKDAEFALLQPDIRKRFYNYLITDLRAILGRLEDSAAALTSTMLRSESRQRELLAISMSNILARDVLHKVKSLLPLMGPATTETFTERLKLVSNNLRMSIDASVADRAAIILDASASLDQLAEQLTDTGATLRGLHDVLVGRLRRGSIDEQISLGECIEEAVLEFKLEQSLSNGDITVYIEQPVKVRADRELLKSVLRNLLLNALQGPPACDAPRLGPIGISLEIRKSGDRSISNRSRNANLSVEASYQTRTGAMQAHRSLIGGLEGQTSRKAGGSGVGLELAKLVFDYSLGAHISAVLSENVVALVIELSPGTGGSEIIGEIQ